MRTFYLAAIASCLAAAPAVHASEALAQKGGCAGCHAKDRKMVGPAFQEIAAKYKGQKDAAGQLAAKVRSGTTGTWGTLAMPPSGADKISDADLKAVIEWVLKGAG